MGRGRIIGLVGLLVAVLTLAVAASAPAYRFVPDPGFAGTGAVNLLAVNQPGGTFYRVREVQPGPNGSVWVHYRALAGPEQYECEAQSYLARYLPSGAPDTSLGSGGFVALNSPIGCAYPTLAVDGASRPLVTWSSEGGSQAPSTGGIVRYTTAGVPDPGFGSGGVALVSLPCPGGTYLDPHSDPAGNLLLSFGCRADESAQGLIDSFFQAYIARLLANGSLDTGFGSGGFLALPSEPGWELPGIAAVEKDGSAILVQATPYAEGAVPTRSRLLRLRIDGSFGLGYRARAERSLRRVAALAAPYVPEEALAFALRPGGELAVGGDSSRGGWMATLRHDGTLQRGFNEDGYRRFPTRVSYLDRDRHDRLFVLTEEAERISFFRLLPDGNRDRSVGGREGQRLPRQSEGMLRDLVSLWHGRPLLYFTNLGSCTSPQDCAEPAELRRLRFNGRP